MSKYILCVAILATLSQAATAQVDAGSQIRQLPPPPELPTTAPEFSTQPETIEPDQGPPGKSVQVNVLRITGQTIYSEAELIAASGFTPGATLNLAELRVLAARISAFYNQRGYFLTQAYLPPQEIATGSVTIAVVEARYGDIANRKQQQTARRRSPRIAQWARTWRCRRQRTAGAPPSAAF